MHISKAKLPFYPPCEVKCRLQNWVSTLKHDVRLIEKQVRSIEQGRGSLNFLNKILINRKLDWINRNSRKNSFLEKKKPDFLKAYLKALNIRYKNV